MSKVRVIYSVAGNGFRLGSESLWVDPNDFDIDMSDSTIAGFIDEIVTEDFNQRYQPKTVRLDSVVECIKEYLQGENNELA